MLRTGPLWSGDLLLTRISTAPGSACAPRPPTVGPVRTTAGRVGASAPPPGPWPRPWASGASSTLTGVAGGLPARVLLGRLAPPSPCGTAYGAPAACPWSRVPDAAAGRLGVVEGAVPVARAAAAAARGWGEALFANNTRAPRKIGEAVCVSVCVCVCACGRVCGCYMTARHVSPGEQHAPPVRPPMAGPTCGSVATPQHSRAARAGVARECASAVVRGVCVAGRVGRHAGGGVHARARRCFRPI